MSVKVNLTEVSLKSVKSHLQTDTMAEGFKKDDDHLPDHWLSNWEQKTVDGWDSDSSLEDRIQNENDRCKQKLWASFQASASSISHLYKGLVLD